ncbi:MAG TPA: ABC transporter permease [Methanocorpusculum sp.]|nr:ABC transporter permease [Methanocorpusculum sp.]
MDAVVSTVDPILFIGIFGAVVVSFLWLRDARIFARTGAPGYRTAAYRGVLFTALGWGGCALCGLTEQTMYFIGIGCVLLALYLQSRVKKENVWKGDESALTRFIGSAPRQTPSNFKEVEEIKREK